MCGNYCCNPSGLLGKRCCIFYIYDYADYCPVPNKVESPDYTLIMSVCSLWREGTHYGWDYVSPWDETTPVLGYYDEGIPETADWEIKYMVEHGIDFQSFCWYPDKKDAPFKNLECRYHLHDGFMNAEYSHMMKYCLINRKMFLGWCCLSFSAFQLCKL